jgi:hypothetical protein
LPTSIEQRASFESFENDRASEIMMSRSPAPAPRRRRRATAKTSRLLIPLLAAAVCGPAVSIPAGAEPSTPGGSAGGPSSYITFSPRHGSFPLVAGGRAIPLVVSGSDYAGVRRAAGDLRSDLRRATGVEPALVTGTVPSGDIVLIGTIGKSPLIDRLISSRRLDVRGIAGKWETSLEQVVNNPLPGVRRAFVIAGSDQRGTIFGIYDVSKQLGVSPWHFWDDVPVPHHSAVYALPGRHTQGTPAVRIRGFFINDENPNLGTWGPQYFGPGLAPGFQGGFNSKLYAKVFEALLRAKGNYLWPAVWGRAFAEDDPANHATATEYGVIMGTSHEAPMMRGIEEWNRHARPAQRDAAGNIVVPGSDPYGGTGEWSFRRNPDAIKAYWRDGIRRMVREGFEGVVTLGMRGNGDVSLPDGDGIELMESIIAAQRQILAEETGRDVTTIPQVWTLYKEVQRYWDRGLRAPDDVTVIFTDDNWGNLRKMPDPADPARAGGYGIYYHYDYVGGGRNYKWVDTINHANTWEQLNMAYGHGVRNLWVVNVGDMKNEEMPLQFFLDYAWDPGRYPIDKLHEWEKQFAAQNFPANSAGAIAGVLHDYGVLQARRKPELLNRKITTTGTAVVYDDQANPYSLVNFREMDRVTAQWQDLAARAEWIGRTLPARYRDAYFQLVLYAVKATANLYAFRNAEFTNILYAGQGRAATNDLADLAEARFAADQALMTHYNTAIAGGKWKDWMLQPHIDYGDVARYGPNAPWQQPEINNVAIPDVIFPAVQRITLPAAADMGVGIDGSQMFWSGSGAAGAETGPATLPTFSPYQSQPGQYIDVFNRGATAFDYSVRTGAPYLTVDRSTGRVDKQERVNLRVDWARAPTGTTTVPITVTGNGASVLVQAVVQKPDLPRHRVKGFVEANGYVSIDGDHYSRAVDGGGVRWKVIPEIGRDSGGVTAFPPTAASVTPGGDSPRLEYTTTLFTTGEVTVWTYLSPRNNVRFEGGLKYAVSIDGETPKIIDVIVATGANDTSMNRQWERNTSDNVNRTSATFTVGEPGVHTVKIWLVDPTVVVQKVVVDTGGLQSQPSYLGPPESTRR